LDPFRPEVAAAKRRLKRPGLNGAPVLDTLVSADYSIEGAASCRAAA
jgi:hypothetical protein